MMPLGAVRILEELREGHHEQREAADGHKENNIELLVGHAEEPAELAVGRRERMLEQRAGLRVALRAHGGAASLRRQQLSLDARVFLSRQLAAEWSWARRP